MFNPFSVISDLNDACQAGKALENPAVWSKRATPIWLGFNGGHYCSEWHGRIWLDYRQFS